MWNNLALLPPVKRARGYRLYTESKRFVDLYLDGGRAVLGHNAPNVLRELKNAAERSLFAPYPSYYTGRFEKALSLLFPGKSFVVYGSSVYDSSDLEAVPSAKAVPSAIRARMPVWRPYMDCGADDFLALLPHPLAPEILVVRPQGGTASGVCYEPSASGKRPVPGAGIGGGASLTPSGETPAEGVAEGARPERGVGNLCCRDFPLLYLSPVILALTTRAIYDFLHSPERGTVTFRRVDEALADGPWRREGIYVFPRERVTNEEWSRVFERFLEAGFLIPPTPRDPLILPGELSPGEEKALAECLLEGL